MARWFAVASSGVPRRGGRTACRSGSIGGMVFRTRFGFSSGLLRPEGGLQKCYPGRRCALLLSGRAGTQNSLRRANHSKGTCASQRPERDFSCAPEAFLSEDSLRAVSCRTEGSQGQLPRRKKMRTSVRQRRRPSSTYVVSFSARRSSWLGIDGGSEASRDPNPRAPPKEQDEGRHRQVLSHHEERNASWRHPRRVEPSLYRRRRRRDG